MLDDKIKQEHTIMKEFHQFLNELAQLKIIQRIIPGRINRKQSGSSNMYITYSYPTIAGLKYKLSKGSTSQELFVVSDKNDVDEVIAQIEKIIKKYV